MQYLPLDRSLRPSPSRPVRVLQFGEGNFLRCFVDWMIHEMNRRTAFDAGVTVVQPIERGLADLLNEQGGLYTVLLTGVQDGQPVQQQTVVDCVEGAIDPYRDFQAYLDQARNPDLRFIISNTTEAGIAFEAQDRMQDAPPSSFPGKLTRLLYERYRHFPEDDDKGLILLPCELIDRNGEQLQSVIHQYARHWDLPMAFRQWLDRNCTFCNTLVDRIVPGYPKDRIAEVREALGYEDKLVTEGERFHLWVIEGPAWIEKEFPARAAGLNVIFTDDMTPYRTRKVRILNGAHTSMVPLGYLFGLRTVQETVEDPVVGKFIADLIYREIIPTLDLPEEELNDFAAAVLDRFRNPFIKHFLLTISLNSTSKYKTRVLPSLLRFFRDNGKLPRRLVLALAALIRFYRGETLEGNPIELKDDPERIAFFQQLWREAGQDLPKLVRQVLAREDYWGRDLNGLAGLAALLVNYLERIETGDVLQVFQMND